MSLRQKRSSTPYETVVRWEHVQFHVTLLWSDDGRLITEHSEVSGKSVAGPRMAVIEDQNAYGCTLFLGQQPRASHAAELDGHEAYVDGKELYFVPERRVKPNFKELARRTGVPQQKLEEAYGTIDAYKLNRRVLQRIMFSTTAGLYEWFTVVSYGPWRSVTFAGREHEVNLRRYVLLQYHVTPFSGHRGRNQTVEAILDSGLWWPDLWENMNYVWKHSLEDKAIRSKPYVIGLVRSREYDGPFRYIIIDFVGPQRPHTPRGNEYMFLVQFVLGADGTRVFHAPKTTAKRKQSASLSE